MQPTFNSQEIESGADGAARMPGGRPVFQEHCSTCELAGTQKLRVVASG
jgi:hypothetical protein